MSWTKKRAIEEGIPAKYIQACQSQTKDGEWRVTDMVDIIANVNEEVQLYGGEIKKFRIYRTHHEHKGILHQLFCSTMENPKTIHDGKVIGSIDIVFDDHIEDLCIVNEFIFSETMLRSNSWSPSAPEKKFAIEVNWVVLKSYFVTLIVYSC